MVCPITLGDHNYRLKMFYQTQTARKAGCRKGPKSPFLSLATLTFDLWPSHSNSSERGANTSSVWICRKSVQRFPTYFIHKQKSHRRRQKQNLKQFTACGKHWHRTDEEVMKQKTIIPLRTDPLQNILADRKVLAGWCFYGFQFGYAFIHGAVTGFCFTLTLTVTLTCDVDLRTWTRETSTPNISFEA